MTLMENSTQVPIYIAKRDGITILAQQLRTGDLVLHTFMQTFTTLYDVKDRNLYYELERKAKLYRLDLGGGSIRLLDFTLLVGSECDTHPSTDESWLMYLNDPDGATFQIANVWHSSDPHVDINAIYELPTHNKVGTWKLDDTPYLNPGTRRIPIERK